MPESPLIDKCASYINTLCGKIPERCVGTQGNRDATSFFRKTLSSFNGWHTEASEFDAFDWKDNGAMLLSDGHSFLVHASPYSIGCDVKAELVSASNIAELEALNARGKIIILHGEITKEQLMPKNFVFYNPVEHQQIVSSLEKSGASALVCATGRNSAIAGGVYPFPLIEDGDFDIPSVYMTEEEGKELLRLVGKTAHLRSIAERIPGKGYNVTGKKGETQSERIVISAHIDAKKGTPGAIDNATGVAVLLLLAELLENYQGNMQIEIVAFNGEDYYAVPGQMKYIEENQNKINSIVMNINIDGAGYKTGDSAFSLFGLPSELDRIVHDIIRQYPGISEGAPWPQGDHSIFVQMGRPAVAVSSKWFVDNMESQTITHTKNDNPEIVDVSKLVEIAQALNTLIRKVTCGV